MQIMTFKPTSHKIKALVYWASWSWKTSFWATAPNVIYASAEAWLLSVGNKQIDYVEIKTVKDFQDLLLYLKNEKHQYQTVVIDSITEINDIIKIEIEKKKWRPLQIQDWWEIAKKIESILREFRWLDMHVLFIAQEQDITDDNKISKIVPSLNGKSATKIAYFMDIVWHMEVTPSWEHVIQTLSHPKLLSKDRTSLIGNSTEANFQEWINKLEQIEIWEQTKVGEYNGIENQQQNQYETYREILTQAKDIQELQTIYTNILKNFKETPDIVTTEQKKDIASLKDDMKTSLMRKQNK